MDDNESSLLETSCEFYKLTQRNPYMLPAHADGLIKEHFKRKLSAYKPYVLSKGNGAPILVIQDDKDFLTYSPILSALIVYSQLIPVTLKPCMSTIAKIIHFDTKNTKSANFWTNTYNKNVDKVLLKMFLEQYFKDYYPNSIRR